MASLFIPTSLLIHSLITKKVVTRWNSSHHTVTMTIAVTTNKWFVVALLLTKEERKTIYTHYSTLLLLCLTNTYTVSSSDVTVKRHKQWWWRPKLFIVHTFSFLFYLYIVFISFFLSAFFQWELCLYWEEGCCFFADRRVFRLCWFGCFGGYKELSVVLHGNRSVIEIAYFWVLMNWTFSYFGTLWNSVWKLVTSIVYFRKHSAKEWEGSSRQVEIGKSSQLHSIFVE